jgi:putative ABC transport system permease protein
MSIFWRITSFFYLAVKRLVAQPGLALATLLGLLACLSLTISIPIYTNAVYNRVLRQEIAQRQDSFAARRPPFSFLFGFFGSMVETKEWKDIQLADTYFRQSAGQELGLPQEMLVRSFNTDKFQLFGESQQTYGENPLEWVNFAFLSDLEQHISLVEGSFPQVAEDSSSGAADSQSPVDVLMSEALANQLGSQVGETYITYVQRATDNGSQSIQFPVRIAGIWKPTDAQESYWFSNPSSFDRMLFVPEETLAGRLSGSMTGDIYSANWYFVMDGSGVDANKASTLSNRIRTVKNNASRLLPQTILMTSPEDALKKYQGLTNLLSFTLYAYVLPILTLLLAFISLVVGLTVGEQHNEIAILRSRGGTLFQVVAIAGLQASLLGLLALLISFPVGMLIAQLISKTRSFFDFSAINDLTMSLPKTALQTGLILVGITIFAQVMPTIGAARHTIVTYKMERARSLRPPWWQRAWLDVALLIPAAYGVYLLRKQGGLGLPTGGVNVTSSSLVQYDPFQNPLLLLVPTLCIFALTLFMIRLLPHFVGVFARLASRTPSISFLLAVRQLSRTPGYYTATLILLVLNLSLSAFTASLAKTLDRHLIDQTYYQVGSDASLQDLGEQLGGSPSGTAPSSQQGSRWFFLPVSEYLKLPGVEGAARLGKYTVNVSPGTGTEESLLFGVDRLDFRHVAYWRSDFASSSLGTLMNRLAVDPAGVLVSRNLMQKYGLRVGDPLKVILYADEVRRELTMNVVGDFDLFPTWYPSGNKQFLLVGNLDNIYEQAGSQLPYDVWLKTDLNLNQNTMAETADSIGLSYIGLQESPSKIYTVQQRPERQGLFGVLSVGFAASALLTVLGFFLYALFSFRRRFIELGILRAVGLTARDMISSLACELASLLLIGLVVGTGLGIFVSQLFIPYLQIGTEAVEQVPSYLVVIAWPEIFRNYALLGILFVTALSVLGVLLMRMKIFQAVKLGETT